MSHSKSDLKSVVAQISSLPTIPETGMRILRMASNPDVSLQELSREIQRDPSLAARVLRVANSPFYGMSRQVDSLQLATVILGLNEVRNVALGLSLFRVLERGAHTMFSRRQFWLHSASCAVVACILGRKLGFHHEGVEFLAGLLHDMGKIVMDEYFHAEFARVHENTLFSEIPMLVAERELFGESHDQVGGWLADKWDLPAALQEAITHHHDFLSPENEITVQNPQLVSLCYVAEAFCSHYRIGWDGDAGCCNMKDPKVWDILLSNEERRSPCRIDQLLTETFQAFNEARSYILMF
jgi:putative nucleotidyltransferase with HDIG domain